MSDCKQVADVCLLATSVLPKQEASDMKAKKKLILFIDSGDTLVDESTEVREVPGGVVLRAKLAPGAAETITELKSLGYAIALVADGLTESFYRSYGPYFESMPFDAMAISEEVGEEKPSPLMFQRAMDLLGLEESDKHRILMVGNNISRDILGAKRFGIRSALMAWSPRYCMEPGSLEETPDYRLGSVPELLALAAKLEKELSCE